MFLQRRAALLQSAFTFWKKFNNKVELGKNERARQRIGYVHQTREGQGKEAKGSLEFTLTKDNDIDNRSAVIIYYDKMVDGTGWWISTSKTKCIVLDYILLYNALPGTRNFLF